MSPDKPEKFKTRKAFGGGEKTKVTRAKEGMYTWKSQGMTCLIFHWMNICGFITNYWLIGYLACRRYPGSKFEHIQRNTNFNRVLYRPWFQNIAIFLWYPLLDHLLFKKVGYCEYQNCVIFFQKLISGHQYLMSFTTQHIKILLSRKSWCAELLLKLTASHSKPGNVIEPIMPNFIALHLN